MWKIRIRFYLSIIISNILIIFLSQDLEKYNGLRPWEIKEQEQENVDLSKSAGKIVAEEGR